MTQRRELSILIGLLVVLGAYYGFRYWHRPPAIEYDNLKYVQLLSTAVSARNPEWLSGVEKAISLRVESGKMSPREANSFQKIVQTASSGNWEQADRECFALAEAQLNRRRKYPPSEEHEHPHGGD